MHTLLKNDPVKILFMADVNPNPDSGAAGTELQTIKELRKLGLEIDEVWSDGLPHRIKHGNLHYLAELPTGYRNCAERMLRIKSYKVVHVNQPHGYLAAKLIANQYPNTVFVHRSHGFELRAKQEVSKWEKKFPDLHNNSGGRIWASKIMSGLLDKRPKYCTLCRRPHCQRVRVQRLLN